MQGELTLILPARLREQIATEARAAFPRECCGLIEGLREGCVVRAVALHPCANLAAQDDCFEIDPARHVRVLRELRGTGRQIVGCYHSHPNGRCMPSAKDAGQAVDDGFLWLVAALDSPAADVAIGSFVYRDRAFAPLAVSLLDRAA
ncbi:MAG TPA: M67 family metallopeptidase [Rhizomicrobium sp.]|jgi:proteasome lid subunit RPN8/RPN11|nr:M67 family metallopeptidase [Rhizomicrobium sp.]